MAAMKARMIRERRVWWMVLALACAGIAGCSSPSSDDDDDVVIDAPPPIDSPPPLENCDNVLDDDGDDLADCDDPDCAVAEQCVPEMMCADGRDNDRDDQIDCADTDCATAVQCLPEGDCTNGTDDDEDGDTDCADTDCATFCLTGCAAGEQLLVIPATGLPGNVDASELTLDFPVPATGWISGIAVRFTVQHSFPADLDVSMRAPGGTPVLDLTSDNGGTGMNYVDTYLSDNATSSITTGTPPFTGRYRPEQSLASLVGRPATGTWQLVFRDDFAGEAGTVQSADVFACVCDGTAGCEQLVACLDGQDNDGDALVDCDDIADCGAIPQCTAETACDDGQDNDLDGNIDCADPNCVGITGCEQPESTCTDNFDNDADLAPDCADSDCTATAHCQPEVNCGNGIDDDLDGRADCLDVGCEGVGICELGTELSCGDGVDNDADLQVDCADSDCAPLFACTACPAGTLRVFRDAADVPLAIPSNVTVRSTIPMAPNGLVHMVAVKLDITHTNDADLDIVLEHSAGTLDLSSDNGGTGDHYTGTVFIDSAGTAVTAGTAPFAGSFRPEQALSTVFGRPVTGNWTLAVTDDNPSATGILHDYQLVVCRCDPASGNCEIGAACRNGIDDDGDNIIDCDEASCAADPVCVPEANCSNGLDDDLDGFADCGDTDCGAFPGCEPGSELTCDDSFDNDADGDADCADTDCASVPHCLVEIDCDNGLDDDANGAADCADPACANDVWCLPEADCADGTDDDGDGATDCADLGCDGLQGCTLAGERECGDGLDNDGDGGADCADTQCALYCAIAACPAGHTKHHYFAAGLPVAIPDNNLLDPLLTTINASAPGIVSLAAVRIDVAHVNDTDLDIFLSAPNGMYELTSDNGSTGDNYTRTVFLDAGAGRIGTTGFTTAPFTGSFISEWPLGGLAGVSAAGPWTLSVADDLANNVGQLLNYELLLCQCDPATGDCEVGAFACRNGVDDDGDGLVDCAETSCAGDRTCMPPPLPATETVCNDGLNDDGDGATDCADSDCAWVCDTLGSVCAAPRQLLRYGAVDLPQTISPTSFVHINSPFRVAHPGTVFRAAVRFNATHTADDDLQLFLASPAGTNLELSSGNGSTGDNYVNTVFVDTAAGTIGTTGFTAAPFTGRYRPEEPLSLLAFEEAEGLWWAQLRDIGGTADGGTWSELSLGICVIPPPP
jgi:subtilisin-like proprotein convertase family protein